MNITGEYIRGLVEGEGSFTFHRGRFSRNGEKEKVPTFALAMNTRDKNLIKLARDYLGLKNKIYTYGPYLYEHEGINRGGSSKLFVRDFNSIKNVIVPFFYKRLLGYKKRQFEEWIHKMGHDPAVSEKYRLIYRLYKKGFWENPENYIYSYLLD